MLTLHLTPKCISEVKGAIADVFSFMCIIMASIWLKILVAIDQRNQVIQAKNATIDIEVTNIKSLLRELEQMRNTHVPCRT